METEKKYLKTIEEVSDALAAGKVVFCDAIKTKYHKDKNNLIIGESEEFGDYVGDFVEMQYSPYILEPKPLEVKLWHLYETNNGNIIFIISDKGKGLVDCYFLGLDIKEQDLAHFYECGTFEGEDDGWDLVKELADLSKYFEKGN
ncbi:MAG TPA: hypothetical protein IAB21_03495 [Candidatus Avelusimicrobium excrementipullorum]|nr:hypothetical protein [Candidatus Avelusimicrobium excrementipullorum]